MALTPKERDELDNAHAQANGAQYVLMALLIGLSRREGYSVVIEEAFELAAQTCISGAGKPEFAEIATRTLQVVDDMRKTVIPHKPPHGVV